MISGWLTFEKFDFIILPWALMDAVGLVNDLVRLLLLADICWASGKLSDMYP